jgi:predicted outer membrane repeat protein
MCKGMTLLLVVLAEFAVLCSPAKVNAQLDPFVVGTTNSGEVAQVLLYHDIGEGQWAFESISPPPGSGIAETTGVYSFAVFQGELYAGTSDRQIWRYNGRVNGQHSWTLTGQLDPSGGGQEVWSLGVFGNDLYAGTNRPDGFSALYKYRRSTSEGDQWVQLTGTHGFFPMEDQPSYPTEPGNGLLLRGVAVIDEHRDPGAHESSMYLGDVGSDLIRRYDGVLVNYEMNIPWASSTGDFGSCIWDYQEYKGYYYAISEWGVIYVRIESQNPPPPGDPVKTSKNWYRAFDRDGLPWVDQPVYHLVVWDNPRDAPDMGLQLYAAARNKVYWIDTSDPYQVDADDRHELFFFDYQNNGYDEPHSNRDDGRLDPRDDIDHITALEAINGNLYVGTAYGYVYSYDGQYLTPIRTGGPGVTPIRSMKDAAFTHITLVKEANKGDKKPNLEHTVDRETIWMPGTLVYTIKYDLQAGPTASGSLQIIDELPPEVTPATVMVESSPSISYVLSDHMLRWDLQTLSANDRKSGTITVKVPIGIPLLRLSTQFRNTAYVTEAGAVVKKLVCDTFVSLSCIYVDHTTTVAPSEQTGLETHPFKSLADGLDAASRLRVREVKVKGSEYALPETKRDGTTAESFHVRSDMTVSAQGAVTLRGTNKEEDVVMIVDGGFYDSPVVRGFTLQGQAKGTGISTGFNNTVGTHGSNGRLILDGCTVRDFKTGVRLVDGTYTIKNGCVISGNTKHGVWFTDDASTEGGSPQGALTLENCTITGSGDSAVNVEGGGNISLVRCAITNHSGAGQRDAAVVVQPATDAHTVKYEWDPENHPGELKEKTVMLTSNPGAVIIDGCRFADNKGQKAGVLYMKDATATVDVAETTFVGNECISHGGGAITTENCAVNVRHSWFVNNTGWMAGALFLSSGDNSLFGSTFSGNTCVIHEPPYPPPRTGDGGAVHMSNAATLGVWYCTFDNNAAGRTGGAIWTEGPVSAYSSAFAWNHAADPGLSPVGGAILSGAQLTLINCTFSENYLENGGHYGTAVYLTGSEGTVKNCLFWNTQHNPTLDTILYSDDSNFFPSYCNLTSWPATSLQPDSHFNFGEQPDLRPIGTRTRGSEELAVYDYRFRGALLTYRNPCIDQGDAPPSSLRWDVQGDKHDRTVDISYIANRVDGTDIGAYEFQRGACVIFSHKSVYVSDGPNKDENVTIFCYGTSGSNDSPRLMCIYGGSDPLKTSPVYQVMIYTSDYLVTVPIGEFDTDSAYVVKLYTLQSDGNGGMVPVEPPLTQCVFFIDPLPPDPSPMQFEIAPYYDSVSHSIKMTAVLASSPDPNIPDTQCPIEYCFLADPNYGGIGSRWQKNRVFEVNNVEAGCLYAYAVMARYETNPGKETKRSPWAKVLTPPVMEIRECTSTKMQTCKAVVDRIKAYDATLNPDVRFYFENITRATNSGWISQPTWIQENLTPSTQYTCRMKMRFLNDTASETDFSDGVAASTLSAEALDNTPPRPDPMTWATEPHAVTNTSIEMVATTAFDLSGSVMYYFECVSNPNHDSGWVNDPCWVATGLVAGQPYTFRVKARDNAKDANDQPQPNETEYSTARQAYADADAPTNLEWGPAGVGSTVIQVRAQATDAQPYKEFFFECRTTSETSGWLSKEADLWVGGESWGYNTYVEWTHSNLQEGQTYVYRFMARDAAGNTTDWSADQSYLTSVEIDPPEQVQWADPCLPSVGSTMATLQAMTAIAGGVWVDYQFVCVNDANFTSTWQLGKPSYTVRGLSPNTAYEFLVFARKHHRTDLVSPASVPVTFQTLPEDPNHVARIVETGVWFGAVGAAVSEAIDGQTIEISEGTHPALLDLTGRRLTLRGTDPNNWTVVEGTVLSSGGAAPVVRLGSDCECTLEGLTIADANDPNAEGGGVFAHAWGTGTITKCILKNNRANYGGGIYGSVRVTKCLFEDNHAAKCGGAVCGSGPLVDCEFNSNSAGDDGGGVYGNGVSLVNCLVHQNSSGDDGGGLWASGNSTVVGCVFLLNTSTGDGAGVHYINDSLTLTNCTFLNNTATGTGGGLYDMYCEGPRITNCIFWGNGASSHSQIGGYLPYVYSSLIGGATLNGGYIYENGNTIAHYKGGVLLTASPSFTDEYHLSVSSPCLDVGLNPGELPATDIDGNRRVMGAAVDLGADEYFVPDVTPPSPAPSWAMAPAPAPADSNTITMTATTASDVSTPVVYYFKCVTDPNHDSGWILSPTYEDSGLTPQTTYTYQVRARDAAGNLTDWSVPAQATTQPEGPVNVAYNLTTSQGYPTIQEAVTAASSGQVIEVVSGTHVGVVDFGSKNLTLQSTDPNNWTVVENTVIHGSGTAPVVSLGAGTLRGLTITGGNNTSTYGGGVYHSGSGAATISKCLVKDNTASYGGGVYGASNTTVTGCRIENNHATHEGGGLRGVATATDCTFTSNSASQGGGGVEASSVTVTNCTFTSNSAGQGGGAIQGSTVTATNSKFISNSTAAYGGGAVDSSNTMTLTGCVFYDNSSTGNGGAVRIQNGLLTMVNCTLRNNTATGTGGGLYDMYCEGPEVTNCIFWGNTAGSGQQMGGYRPYLHYCAIGGAYTTGSTIEEQGTGLTLGYDHGHNLLSTDPNFRDEFHLACDSACIDKGKSVGGLPATDIDGDARTLNWGIEIGADEVNDSTVPPPLGPFGEELDNAVLTFTTGGAEPWFGQTSTYHYDGDAAQSGAITDAQDSWLQTSVGGAGTITFWWKVSSEGYCDKLEFWINGTRQYYISGNQDWQQKTSTITGAATLKWRYQKDYSISSGSDCGWLDYVVFTPTP